MIRCLCVVVMLFAVSGAAAAGGFEAGHVSLSVNHDDYGDDAFIGGRDDPGDMSEWSVGGTARYVREPTGRLAWLPPLGIGVSYWGSSMEGNCCGFAGTDVDVTFTTLDLLVANVSESQGTREVLYLVGGATSADVDADFDTDPVEGITAGRETGFHVGLGLFAGEAGGFTGGLEARYTKLPDFDMTTAWFTVGVGF